MATTMRFEGGARLANELASLPKRASRSIQRAALRAAAEPVRARASSLAPRDPGAPDLADNIGVSNARPEDGSVGVAVGPTSKFFYGLFQEEGTSRHGAQPFMRPALDANVSAALTAAKFALAAAIIRAGGGTSRTGGGGGLV